MRPEQGPEPQTLSPKPQRRPTISDEAQREKELQEYRQQKATKEYMTELDTLALEHSTHPGPETPKTLHPPRNT
jgi:hypothetical protein